MSIIVEFFESHSGLIVAVGAVVGAIASVIGVWFKMKKEKTLLDEANEHLRKENTQLNKDAIRTSERIGKLITKCNANYKAYESVKNKLEQLIIANKKQIESLIARHQITTDQLSKTIENKTTENVDLDNKIKEKEKRQRGQEHLIRRFMKLEGELWESKTLTGIPRFRPLQERQTAIISVLTLKGGVGKTTVAANLGSAFAAKGYRVLLVDLDLQGSLTSLFIPNDIISSKDEEKLLLQHYLAQVSHQNRVDLRNFVLPILDGTGSGIVGTSDHLAYSEMNLTMKWLLRIGKRKDTRFLLRRALHQKRIFKRYDIIILDCPPIINTCCVNALTASDYVLSPIILSQNSIERIPSMLETLKRLSAKLNPTLQVVGVVANRTRRNQLTVPETQLWDRMRTQGQDKLGVPLHGFETVIPDSKEVRELEDTDFSAPLPGSMLFEVFQRLSSELEERLPCECRRFITAPQQHEPFSKASGCSEAG